MGKRIEGHGDCLICHPDLDKKWAKAHRKGKKYLKPSVRRKLQGDKFEDAEEKVQSD